MNSLRWFRIYSDFYLSYLSVHKIGDIHIEVFFVRVRLRLQKIPKTFARHWQKVWTVAKIFLVIKKFRTRSKFNLLQTTALLCHDCEVSAQILIGGGVMFVIDRSEQFPAERRHGSHPEDCGCFAETKQWVRWNPNPNTIEYIIHWCMYLLNMFHGIHFSTVNYSISYVL